MKVLDLFSGIGGFSLGLERAGMTTVAFCEINPFCRRVLAKHWPGVPIYDDVQTLTAARLVADGIVPDVICGGFPCQDISVAGRGAGLDGARSGLWSEYARLIGEIRPAWVIIENVPALRSRGLDTVLGQIAAIGYNAEWYCIPASAVGAPHLRDRVWIIAYPAGIGCERGGTIDKSAGDLAERLGSQGRAGCGVLAHPDSPQRGPGHPQGHDDGRAHDDRADRPQGADGAAARGALADTDGGGRREQGDVGQAAGDEITGQSGDGGEAFITGRPRLAIGEGTLREWSHAATTGDGWWAAEPDLGRVVDGPAARVDRRKRLIALGNGVVPQIPEIIGRAILAAADPTPPWPHHADPAFDRHCARNDANRGLA